MRVRLAPIICISTICLLQPNLRNAYSSDAEPAQDQANVQTAQAHTMLAQVVQPPADQQPAAQVNRPVAPTPAAPTPGDTPLESGDVVSVEVKGEPAITGVYYVRPEGTIELPMVGAIRAAGMSPSQLNDQVTASVSRFVVNPLVTVLRLGGASRVVSILGAVIRPGTYDIGSFPTTLALLGAAGGTAPEADLQRMVLVRGGETVPLTKSVASGQLIIPSDIRLKPADAIVVPSLRERSVRVIGAVAQPGLAAIEQALTASRAVLAAGGPIETADLSEVQILRDSEVIQVNLRPILRPDSANRGTVEDIVLQLDDIVMVPQTTTRSVHITGAVRAPGEQDAQGVGVASTAVVAAGGATENGDLSRAYVLRGGERLPLDLTPLLQPDQAEPGAQATDVAVRSGDIVVVPERNPIFVIGAVNAPGGLPAGRATTLSHAIVQAGGLAPDADGADAFVLRDGRQIRVDLRALLMKGDTSVDVPLQPQDAIVVPRRSQVVRVVGQVTQPGAIALDAAETLVDAVGLAGGPTDAAKTTGIILLRDGESRTIDIDAIMSGKAVEQNVALQPGDTIIFPRIEEEVYLLGAVAKPGIYPIHEGDTFIDVIAEAGGPAGAARTTRIAVVRRAPLSAGGIAATDESAADDRAEYLRELRAESSNTPTGSAARDYHARPGSLGASKYRPRAAAERPKRPKREQRSMEERIQDSNQRFTLLELADVEPGNPAYLLQPGDVIYLPPRDLSQRVWNNVIGDLLMGLTFRAAFGK